jgi:hypothetical protein
MTINGKCLKKSHMKDINEETSAENKLHRHEAASAGGGGSKPAADWRHRSWLSASMWRQREMAANLK